MQICPRSIEADQVIRSAAIIEFPAIVRVVEAAGVEPASERARREENYVRIRLRIFGSGFRAGKRGRHLARLISVYGSGPKPLTYPVK